MPTKEEFKELKEKCQWQWLSGNGRKGYIVKGPNGKSIFLPAAGYRYGTSLSDEVKYGYYWSSALDASSPASALCLHFSSSGVSFDRWYNRSRCYASCIRPVAD